MTPPKAGQKGFSDLFPKPDGNLAWFLHRRHSGRLGHPVELPSGQDYASFGLRNDVFLRAAREGGGGPRPLAGGGRGRPGGAGEEEEDLQGKVWWWSGGAAACRHQAGRPAGAAV